MSRLIKVASHFNLRDLGGLQTGAGDTLVKQRLYRGAGLHRLTGKDLRAVRALSLSVVLDLRSSGELRLNGALEAADLAKTVRHIPMFETIPDFSGASSADPIATLTELYMGMLSAGAETIATAITLLADEEHLPMLFYCAAGKDRTGVMSAVILKLIGISDEQIVADYAASQEPMEALLRWIEEHDLATHEMMVKLPHGLTAAPAEAMSRFLAQLDERYGSVEEYVQLSGVSGRTVDQLRHHLLA